MPRLIILRGNSGSGKSTIAKRLQKELGDTTMLIPQDVVRREMLQTKDTPDNPSIQLIRELARYGHRIGYDVIIEGILARKRYETIFQELMNTFEHTHTYYFDIPFDETLRRHNLKPNSHEFGETEMRRWWLDDDQLGDKDEKIITDTLNEDEIVRSILVDLNYQRL